MRANPLRLPESPPATTPYKLYTRKIELGRKNCVLMNFRTVGVNAPDGPNAISRRKAPDNKGTNLWTHIPVCKTPLGIDTAAATDVMPHACNERVPPHQPPKAGELA